jgi:hypothetical protein
MHVQGSHDAVVLDFWVRAKVGGSGSVIGHLRGASNEGSPAAIKRHGGGPHDTFHFEIDGEPIVHQKLAWSCENLRACTTCVLFQRE